MVFGGIMVIKQASPLLAKQESSKQERVENFLLKTEDSKEIELNYTVNGNVVNELGDNAKPIIPSSYFSWENWQKDSVLVSASAVVDSPSEVPDYSSHRINVMGWKTISDGDTIAQVNFPYAGVGVSMNGVGQSARKVVSKRWKLSPQGQFEVTSPALDQWTNLPSGITALNTPITVNSGYYKDSSMVYVVNDELFTTMGGGNVKAGPMVSLPEGKEAKATWRFDYMTFPFPEDGNFYEDSLLYNSWFFQPRVVKSSFRAIEEPNKELTAGEVSGTGLKMDDPVNAKAKDIEGYLFDHYEYIDQYGKTQTGTADSWSGNMDITKKGIVWWYKKKVPELSLTKSADTKRAVLGDTLTYTVTMKNTGTDALKDVRLTDTLPTGLSKPTNVQLNGQKIGENKENASASGDYFTWDETARKLIIYSNHLAIDTQKVVTYDTTVTEGTAGETKVNTAQLTGSNTPDAPTAEETVTIQQKAKGILHVKQEILQKNNQLVVPTTGSLQLKNVPVTDPLTVKGIYTMTIPSYEADTNQVFKEVSVILADGAMGYDLRAVIPEFYVYKGYQLTTEAGNHASNKLLSGTIPILDYTTVSEYWVTIYIQPTVASEGPPYYSWDEKMNDFGQLTW